MTPGLTNTVILVGGSTADLKDVQALTDIDFHNMIIVVLIGIFIVLLLVLGSVLIPLRLILTISLSISWTLALTMVIFEDIRGMPLLWLLPMILFVVMMGLGMDYDIFLCTRIREEVTKGSSDVKAIVTSVERTGGIITACGAIMAGALGSMMLSSMGLLQQFGFALFFAILIDATIVRIYLVPAIMVLLTKWNWWAPGPLQRVKRDKKMLEAKKKPVTKQKSH
jgi:RND superfamily putative drug exporter